jgi:hypothetical protein
VNSTSYGAFKPHEDKWLNITGLKKDDGFAWDFLDGVKARAKEQIGHIVGKEEDVKVVVEGGVDDHGTFLNLPVWKNVSGHVRGIWVRSKLDAEVARPTLNASSILPWDARDFKRQWERNITGNSGDLRFDFTEKGEAEEIGGVQLQNMKAEIVLQDKASSGDGWSVVMYGTHLVDSGHMVLTTTSDKFAGMWALPQLALTEKMYGLLNATVVDRLQTVIKRQKKLDITALNPYSSMPEGRLEDAYTPRCELVAYLQQHPLLQTQPDGELFTPTTGMISEMEEELRHPEGARPYIAPEMTFSALIFSPDCGFVIESKGPPDFGARESHHLVGEKWEVYIRTSIDWTLVFGLVLAGQVYLTISQMKHASTPSTRSRISFYTIGMLSLGDGIVGMAFLPLGMLIDSAFPSLLATAFFAFLAVTFFDMRFLLDVWSVQLQERRRAERQAQQQSTPSTSTPAGATTPQPTAATTPAPIITAAGADTLPLPVTARQAISSGATPIVLPPTTETTDAAPPETEAGRHRRDLGSLYGKFYLVLLCVTFLSLHATSWYPRARSIYTNLIAFLYLSLWVPQIYRNIMRNCRKALLYRFVIGQSALRLLPVGYFYCYAENVLWVKSDRRVFAVLAGWVWCQVWVLVIQDVLGPRIGVPKRWLPPAYDYHPVLREDDAENGKMPIGFTTASTSNTPLADTSKDKDKSKRTFDCAICMQGIEVPVVPAGAAVEGSTVHSMVARRLYMLTPCRHIFHTQCLEAAMRYRLQCPVCREGLPPL